MQDARLLGAAIDASREPDADQTFGYHTHVSARDTYLCVPAPQNAWT